MGGGRAILTAACAIALLGASSAATAPAARPASFTLEDALTLRTFSSLVWSQDASRLAFVVTHEDTAENTRNADLWLWDARRDELLQLTRHPKGDGSPTFSPSGDTIAFVATRGAADAQPSIWMLSLHGGEPWSFGTFEEAIGEVHWSPDGRWLAYVKTDTLPQRIRDWQKQKWDHVVEDERLRFPHLWVVDLRSGSHRQLTTGAQYVWHVRWSPDSKRIAYLVSPTGKPDDGNQVDIGIATPEGAPARRLDVIGGAFAWSPNGRWIAWAGNTDRDVWVQKRDVWVAPAAGGSAINLTAEFDEDGYTPGWSATSDTLFFHSAQGISTVLASVALPHGARSQPRVVLGPDRAGSAGTPFTAGSGRAAWVQGDPRHPDELFVADHAAMAGRAITRFNAAVAFKAMGTTREFTWESSDGVRAGGVLVRPPGARAHGALKTLVWLHGGPYGGRSHLGFEPWAQYLAMRGYQVFMPNFRSSGGSGTAFMVRSRADWGGQDFRDVEVGVDSLIRAGLADPRRLGVFGRSYGGYLTSWTITQTQRYDAAVATALIVDLASLYGQSDVQQYRAFEFQGRPWETPELWRRSSPMTHIARVRTPTLIVGFEEDRRTPIAQAYELYRALLGLGVPTEFVRYPREPHVPREYRHRADLYLRMTAWFDRWVR